MAIFHDTTKAKKIFHDGVKIKQVFYDASKVFNDGVDPLIYNGDAINYIEKPYNFFDVFSNVQIRLVESNGAFITNATVYNEGMHMVMGGMIEFIVSGNYIQTATPEVYFDYVYGVLK